MNTLDPTQTTILYSLACIGFGFIVLAGLVMIGLAAPHKEAPNGSDF